MKRQSQGHRVPKYSGNGHVVKTSFGVADPIALNRIERITANITSGMERTRSWMREFGDDRRSINDECGYPADIEIEDYREMHRRNPIARRVVQLMAKEAHQVAYEIYESEDSGKETEFERALKDLPQRMRGESSWFRGEEGDPLRDVILQCDASCGMGTFGVILFGLDDLSSASSPTEGAYRGLESPVQGLDERGSSPAKKEEMAASARMERYSLAVNREATKGRNLLFARSFDESVVTISQFENNQASPRYGQPVQYQISLNDSTTQNRNTSGAPGGTISVHWSRVVHYAAAELDNSTVFGVPEMRPCWNLLYDIAKIHGASGEAFWRGVMMKTFLETHPQLGGDVEVNDDDLKDVFEQFTNGLQQHMLLKGMTAKSIPPSVVDPSPHLKAKIESICIVKGVPVRVFMGSERGELASSEDAGDWNDKVGAWQRSVTTPRRIVPVYDRLVQVGVLPRPAKGYRVDWPDLESISEDMAATVANKWADVLTKYVSGGLENIIDPMDYLTRICRLTEAEAEALLKRTLRWLEYQEWQKMDLKKYEVESADEWPDEVPVGAGEDSGVSVGHPQEGAAGAPPPGEEGGPGMGPGGMDPDGNPLDEDGEVLEETGEDGVPLFDDEEDEDESKLPA